MLLIVAVLGVLQVNTNALKYKCVPNRGILNSEVKELFQQGNKAFNEQIKWDDDLAKQALRETEKRGSSEKLAIYSEWKQDRSHECMSLLEPVPHFIQKYAMVLQHLPRKARYGCNVNFKTDAKPSRKVTVACVYSL
ncbi:hypothetical protein GCK32_006195 [Trichostrongylus colubriformis]|uniref:SCP domain-containing protein n=1 Tax=Trichostrongylus colubriformis TaxID=6319 RepID=A0AAN8ETG3_TRICO